MELKLHFIGIEPITFGTEIQRSIQLSYKHYAMYYVNISRKLNDTTKNDSQSFR